MKKFFVEMLSNSGKVSSNRTCLFMIVVAVLGWTTFVVATTGTIPDLGASWQTMIGLFIGGSFGGKAAEAYTAVKTGTPTPE